MILNSKYTKSYNSYVASISLDRRITHNIVYYIVKYILPTTKMHIYHKYKISN